MHPVMLHATMPGSARLEAGFTLIEVLVAMVIIAILMAVGIPRMSDWVAGTKAANAASFYAEGFAMARTQALANNSQSRLVFSDNANGQKNWQVDICFRATDTPCQVDGDWSSTEAAAKGAPGTSTMYRSIRRDAAILPASNRMSVALGPNGGKAVYFTPLGWVDTSRANPVTQIDLAPPAKEADLFRASRVVVSMLGIATVCDPTVAKGDSRWCPQ